MKADQALAELQTLLFGLNYQIFLQRYYLAVVPGADVEHYITTALPNAEIGGVQPVSGRKVLEEVEQSLRHAGDAGYGPKSAALNSPKFEKLLTVTLSHFKQALSDATEITTFWLKSGHPAYPVFWDFAFVIIGTNGVEVFMGSSSD